MEVENGADDTQQGKALVSSVVEVISSTVEPSVVEI